MQKIFAALAVLGILLGFASASVMPADASYHQFSAACTTCEG
jgi:hypothetical protein